MLRRGVREAMIRQPKLTLVGEATSGAMALELARELTPDLVIMDIHLQDMDGIEAARQILNQQPGIKIIMFTAEAARPFVDEALQAGACGYLTKSSSLDELLQAIEAVMAGRLYLSPDVSAGILEGYRKSLMAGSEASKAFLSESEKQLLRLVAKGLRNKEISDELGVSVKSIETYRSRLMKKLDCSSPAELVRYAIREGIAEA